MYSSVVADDPRRTRLARFVGQLREIQHPAHPELTVTPSEFILSCDLLGNFIVARSGEERLDGLGETFLAAFSDYNEAPRDQPERAWDALQRLAVALHPFFKRIAYFRADASRAEWQGGFDELAASCLQFTEQNYRRLKKLDSRARFVHDTRSVEQALFAILYPLRHKGAHESWKTPSNQVIELTARQLLSLYALTLSSYANMECALRAVYPATIPYAGKSHAELLVQARQLQHTVRRLAALCDYALSFAASVDAGLVSMPQPEKRLPCRELISGRLVPSYAVPDHPLALHNIREALVALVELREFYEELVRRTGAAVLEADLDDDSALEVILALRNPGGRGMGKAWTIQPDGSPGYEQGHILVLDGDGLSLGCTDTFKADRDPVELVLVDMDQDGLPELVSVWFRGMHPPMYEVHLFTGRGLRERRLELQSTIVSDLPVTIAKDANPPKLTVEHLFMDSASHVLRETLEFREGRLVVTNRSVRYASGPPAPPQDDIALVVRLCEAINVGAANELPCIVDEAFVHRIVELPCWNAQERKIWIRAQRDGNRIGVTLEPDDMQSTLKVLVGTYAAELTSQGWRVVQAPW